MALEVDGHQMLIPLQPLLRAIDDFSRNLEYESTTVFFVQLLTL